MQWISKGEILRRFNYCSEAYPFCYFTIDLSTATQEEDKSPHMSTIFSYFCHSEKEIQIY